MDAEKEVYWIIRNAMLVGVCLEALLWAIHIVASHFVGGVWPSVAVLVAGVGVGISLSVLASRYTDRVLDVVGFYKQKT